MRSLDDIDRSLLQALARDGRAPVRDLALGDSTVSVRLRRLRDSGALPADTTCTQIMTRTVPGLGQALLAEKRTK